jgi:hypothetical protein
MDEWKLALVVPHAAFPALLVAGMAQGVRFVLDRWQGNLLLYAGESVIYRSSIYELWLRVS